MTHQVFLNLVTDLDIMCTKKLVPVLSAEGQTLNGDGEDS